MAVQLKALGFICWNPTYSYDVFIHGHQKRVDWECSGFEGDEDTYGLGIRIGLYFQWITSSIAYNFVPSEAIMMRGINNCFQAAMFAGLLFVTIDKGSHGKLHAVEAYLMLIFCMGGVCSGNLVDDVQDDGLEDGRGIGGEGGLGATVTAERGWVKTGYAYLETSTLGGYVRLLLACGFIAYGLWFVFVGMDEMLDAFPNDCRYAFFLARVDLSGSFRKFLKALFILVAIPALVSLKRGTATLARATQNFFFEQGWQGRAKPKPEIYNESPVTTPPESQTLSPSNNEVPGLQYVKIRLLDVILSGTLLIFIIAVELIIRWNKIEKVQSIRSTGQLLPVIIGVGGVGRVLMRLISDSLEQAALHRQRGR
ncbi:hypothetical protein EV426DRAFT_571309 [Tirmania nivea]|nr:hypothetical protein EV426DRAFT_571309 [Tirmania nivea]